MAKRWLAIREKSIPVLRRSLIVSLSLAAVVGVVYLTKPLLWSGGIGIGKGETVTTERVEKDAKGISVKTTTKFDDGKTLWDWLSLLGVPISLAILGYWLQQNQQKRAEKVAKEQKERDEKIALELRERDEKLAKEQRELAADETKEEVLQVYFDRLSVLLVDKNLLAIASKVYATKILEYEHQPIIEATLEERELLDAAVDVIRARTLSILRRFKNDPDRKTSVIRFLIEAEIISKLHLNLSGADLIGADLNHAVLSSAIFRSAKLNRADLSYAFLGGADLYEANLSNANLNVVYLSGANLNKADLSGANLSSAKLSGAVLYDANLSGADLIGAKLGGADLRIAKLSSALLYGANLCGANLKGADLIGARLNRADFNYSDLNGAKFGSNIGLSDAAKADMKARGAIFKDTL
jgi:uncharacterized protein YjbI with pentapeptide repeats